MLSGLSPLREGSFARYFAATSISSAGTFASRIALAFGILDAGSATDLGLVFLAREIPVVVLLLAGGVYADRLPRRFVLAGANLTQAVSQLAAAVVLLHGTVNTPALAACAAVNGAANAFSRPATSGFVPHVVSPDRLQAANGLIGVSGDVIGIAGTLLGAGLIAAVGPSWALAFDSATFVIAAVLLMTLARGIAPPKRPTSPLADLREGWHAVRSRGWLWRMILSFGPFQLAYFPGLLVLGPQIAREHLHGSTSWAVIISGGLVGAIAGGLFAGSVTARRPLVIASFAGAGAVLQIAGLAAAWPTAVLAVCAAVGSAGLSISDALWFTVLQKHVPDDVLSRVSSIDWLGSMALNPLGYALVGPVSAALGTRTTLGAAAAVLGVASLAPLLSRSVRTLGLTAAEAA